MLSQQHHPVSHSILFIPIANACCHLLGAEFIVCLPGPFMF